MPDDKIIIPVTKIFFPHLDTPRSLPNESFPAKFSVSVPLGDVPEEVTEEVPLFFKRLQHRRFLLGHFTSTMKPFCSTQNQDHMALVREHMADTGCSFEKMVHGAEGLLLLKKIESPKSLDGVSFILTGVLLDFDSLYFPSFNFPENPNRPEENPAYV
jgi:hypothetical protein